MSRRRTARRSAGALAAAVAPLVAADAAVAQSALVPRPMIAAGPLSNVSDALPLPTGAFWMVGAEWEQRGGRPAWRLAVEGWRRESDTPAYGAFQFGCDDRCRQRSRAAVVGLSFDGKYEIGRRRVRPYVASGVGMYRVRSAIALDFTCRGPESDNPLTCSHDPSGAQSASGTSFDVALHAALGTSVGVGRARVFGEMRLHSDPRDSGARRNLLPFLLGVRF